MKPSWLIYAETVRKEIDQMRAKKNGKNVEGHLYMTCRRACDEMQYLGSMGGWEILMRRLGRRIVNALGIVLMDLFDIRFHACRFEPQDNINLANYSKQHQQGKPLANSTEIENSVVQIPQCLQMMTLLVDRQILRQLQLPVPHFPFELIKIALAQLGIVRLTQLAKINRAIRRKYGCDDNGHDGKQEEEKVSLSHAHKI